MRLWALLLAALLWAGAAPAQVVTDAAGLREIGARLLAQGEAGRARELAGALLARDEDDVAALILYARAALAQGQAEAALPAALRAHAVAPPGTARFVAARLAARAHAELGQDLRAQFWLRRSLSDAPSAEAARDVARDVRALRARNPLAVSLSFGIAPSSNVNGGSASETIILPGLPFEFELSGDARALSGLRVEAGATLSYRLAARPGAATFLGAQVSGRTYVLSPEAREQAPDAKGSDYADVVAVVNLTHRWRRDGDSGPSAVSGALGRTWYDGEPYLLFATVARERAFVLDENDRIDASMFVDWTRRRTVSDVTVVDPVTNESAQVERVTYDEYWSLGLWGRWTHRLESGDRTSVSATLRDSLTDLPFGLVIGPDLQVPDTSYDGLSLGLGYDWARPVAGLRLGAAAEVDWRRYGASDFALDGREDVEGTLRLAAGVPRWSVLGFEPVVTVEAGRTWSDVSLYDENVLSIDLGFRSRI